MYTNRGNTLAVVGGIIALVVIVGVGYMAMQQSPTDEMPMGGSAETDMMLATGGADDAGNYEEYAPEKLARATEGDVVLFFHATWCPTCRAADVAIREQADMIPEELTILKVDYDSSIALKQRYGVTVQHTFVQVDADGNEIAKWQGTITPAEIASRVQ